MNTCRIPLLISFATGVILSTFNSATNAGDPLLFATSFAAGTEGAIQTYQFDSTVGTLKPLERTSGIENPYFIVISPNQKFLYSIYAKTFGGKEPEEVAAFALEGRTGRMKMLNRQSTRGTASCYLDIDQTGKTVVVANYTTGNVASLPVRQDGSLGEAASFFQHAGSSVDPVRQLGPNAHCLVISPDNRFALAADLGIDQVKVYRLDAVSSKLSPNQTPFVKTPAGAGPRHLTFHPDGRKVYVINELKSSVTLFDYAADSGVLTERQTVSTLPTDFSGTSNCADVKITADGKFLYGTNRGHDSIAVFRVGADGTLKLVEIVPSGGKTPQNLLISAGGKWLLCANMGENNIVVFRIDEQSGALKATGDPVLLSSPTCLRWLP